MDSREALIVKELSAMRANPSVYVGKIAARRRYYRGNVLRLPRQIPIRTREGVSALDEAVRVLKATKPLPPLKDSPALRLAAWDHVRDIGPKGLLAHEGSDKSSPGERVRRYATDVKSVAEVISFGPEDPESVVIDLIIDDGLRNRGHRNILLDPVFRYAGAACGSHALYRTVCVINLADQLSERQ
jgi:uncharacterized protein YkwD